MMKEIISNTRKVLGAVRGLLFMMENSGICYDPYIVDEDAEAMYKRTQQKKAEEAEDTLGVKRAIIAKLMHAKKDDFDAEAQREEEMRNKLVEHAITMKESILENDPQNPEKSLIIVPIMSSDRACLGAVMMQWKKTRQKFTFDDQKLLESYSVFLSLSLERSKLKTQAQLGSMEVEMSGWVSAEERPLPTVPDRLRMNDEERSALLKIGFDSYTYQSISLFKCIFNLFDMLKLSDSFKLPAQTLYSFLYEIRQTYNPVPYHNWNHAIDATQFLAYEIYHGNLQTVFTPFEILIMFAATICHDCNHDGFSTAFNARAELPLGILFNNQSVLETHHCTVAISVLTKDDPNVFRSFTEEQIKKMWSIFIKLILGTDMYRHWELMDSLKEIVAKRKRRWVNSETDRLTMMQILVKSADLSTACRPWSQADKFELLVCEEFFRQGQLDKAAGMVYVEGFSDRDHLDKEASQIPFYKSVVLPLFEELGRAFPPLAALQQYVALNITKWEEREAKLLEEARIAAEEAARLRALEEEEKMELEAIEKKIEATPETPVIPILSDPT
jgi:hypothetical protein